MAATVIDELVTLLGVDTAPGTDSKIEKFKTTIDHVTTSVSILSAGIVAATMGFLVFAEKSNRTLRDMDNFQRLTGIGVENLQQFKYAIEQVGGNANSLESDLVRLTKTMSSPIPGEYNTPLFILGIQARNAKGELKKADEILLEVAGKMEGMDRIQQFQFGSKLGLSNDTILLLKKGRKGIEQLLQQAKKSPVVISQKEIEKVKQFTKNVDLLWRSMDYFAKVISISVSPSLEKITTRMNMWIGKNKEWIQLKIGKTFQEIQEGIGNFFDILSKISEKVGELISRIIPMNKHWGVFENISGAVTIALAGIAVSLTMVLGKFALIGAAVIGAGLVFEDFVAFVKGGNSAIGLLIDKIDSLWDVFQDRFPAMGRTLKAFGKIFQTIGGIIKDTIIRDLETAKKAIDSVGNALLYLMNKLEKVTSYLGLDKMAEKLSGVFGGLREGFPMNPEDWTNIPLDIYRGMKAQNIRDRNPLSQITNNNNISPVFHIQGKDPVTIANEVSGDLDKLLTRTYPGYSAPVTQ